MSELSLDRSGRVASRMSGSLKSMIVGGLLLALAGCTGSSITSGLDIEAEQGSSANIKSLNQVVRANPSDPEAYNVRGAAYGRSGRSSAALDDFNRAIQMNPRYYQAYANRGLVYYQTGDDARAAADYNAALTINSSYDTAYIRRADVYRRANRPQQALADYNRAIQLGTTDPRAYYNRGLLYQVSRQHDQAIKDFSQALSLADRQAEPYNARATSYLATGSGSECARRREHGAEAGREICRSMGDPRVGLRAEGRAQDRVRFLQPRLCAGPQLQTCPRRHGPHARGLRFSAHAIIVSRAGFGD